MEKIKFKFNEVYFGNNCRKSIKITNQHSWAITTKTIPSSNSRSESQESFLSSNSRCWIRPSSIWGILLSSCSTDGPLTSGSMSANGSNGSRQVSPFFNAFVIPGSAPASWNNLFPFGCGYVVVFMWLLWIGFEVVRLSLTSNCSNSLPLLFCPLT